MKQLLLIIAFLVPFDLLAQDHLLPEQGIFGEAYWDTEYQLRVQSVLWRQAPPNGYRLIVFALPSFLPEWQVSVVQDSLDHLRLFASKALSDSVDLERLGVHTYNVAFSPTLFRAIDSVFNHALVQTHYPQSDGFFFEGPDGDTYHFTALTRVGMMMSGTCWSPGRRSSTRCLEMASPIPAPPSSWRASRSLRRWI